MKRGLAGTIAAIAVLAAGCPARARPPVTPASASASTGAPTTAHDDGDHGDAGAQGTGSQHPTADAARVPAGSTPTSASGSSADDDAWFDPCAGD